MSKEKNFWSGSSDVEWRENHSTMVVESLGEKLFQVQSESHPDKSYVIDTLAQTCTCADYRYRGRKCKHIRAVEENLPQKHENLIYSDSPPKLVPWFDVC